MSATDAVTVSLDVEVEPELAFAVFTRELDTWWGRGPRYRFLAPYQGTLVLEPGVGGRLLHVADAAAGARASSSGQSRSGSRRSRPGRHLAAARTSRPINRPGSACAFEPRRRRHARQRHPHSGWDALPDRHPGASRSAPATTSS